VEHDLLSGAGLALIKRLRLQEKAAAGCAAARRTFSEPLRALVLRMLPFLPAAREREEHFSRLYGIWDAWVKQMQARGPPAADDDSMWACISRVRNPATGAAAAPIFSWFFMCSQASCRTGSACASCLLVTHGDDAEVS
jgi:hypothetical protein